jgi:purine-nucleoside phosphorylase
MSLHIEAGPNDIAETVLITGDPLRAKFIADSMFVDAVCYNNVRGMLGFTGLYNGRRLSVQGTGMGIPSTAIYVHELIHDYGVKRLIRIGTCGTIDPGLRLGEIIVAESSFTDSAAYRMDVETMDNGIRGHPGLLQRTKSVAERLSLPLIAGSVFSTDMFYDDPTRWNHWSGRGVVAVEMETSVIYFLAQRNNVEALTLLTVSDNIITGKAMTTVERREAGHDIMRLALAIAID